MEIKCKDLNYKIPKENAYAVEIPVNHKDGTMGIRREYWSNKEAYIKAEKDKEMLSKCKDYMFYTILGYESGHCMNTGFYKRLSKWHEIYEYEIIYETFEYLFKKAGDFVATLEFDSENQRLNYWCAAIENNLQDVYMRVKREEKIQSKDYDIPDNTELRNDTVKRKVNISRFLEDE